MTPQEIYAAMVASNQQGFGNADIMKGLEKYGVRPHEAGAAYQLARPDLFMQPDEIMANVTAGNFDANANDPRFTALNTMMDYARTFENPAPAAPQVAGTSAPAGMGFQGYGGPAPTLKGYERNPYLDEIAAGMETQSNNNLQRNILPSIRGAAVAAGGVGGSRQGIAEGLAIGDAQTGLNTAKYNLFGNDYNQSQNRNLQQYQADQGYNLGLGNQWLQNQNQMLGYDTQQRSLDQSGARLGADLYNLGTQGQWTPLNQSNGILGNYTGYGNSTTSGTQGGGLGGALGGLLGGAQFGQNMGWWGK